MAPVLTVILTQLPTFVKYAKKIRDAWREWMDNRKLPPPSFRPRPLGMFIGFAMLLLWASASRAASGTVNLAWDANTEPDLSGYRLYESLVPGGPYTFVKEYPKAAVTGTQTVTHDGIFYYVLTAYDTMGSESGYSNEVNYTETSFPPSAPKNLRLAP